MKRQVIFLASLIAIILIGINSVKAQKYISDLDPETADYWLYRMRDKTENYYLLVKEFENFWEGKTPTKNSGHKLFRRWMINAKDRIDENGNYLPPNYLASEYQKFEQQNIGDAIVGTWSFVGPDQFPAQTFSQQCPGLGRISAIAFHPTLPNTLYVGTPSGGVWKSSDSGDNWSNLNTDTIPTMGISAIAVDPNDPSVIYIGTGDRDQGDSWNRGVYKSTDGGNTWYPKWNNMPQNTKVNKLLISPLNPNHLIAATNRGIYKSYNSAEYWHKMGGPIPPTGNVHDLEIKPGDPSVMYATQGGNFYLSTDYGDSWTKSFLSFGIGQRMTIGVTTDNPEKVYLFATEGSKFFRLWVSTNSGVSFSDKQPTAFDDEGQGAYNIDIAVDPNNEDVIYVGMVNLYKSINGGDSFSTIANVGQIHADQHLLEFSPVNNKLYIGNDGGLYETINGGSSFNVISDGLAISQIYRMTVDQNNPNIKIIGTQDLGSYVTAGGEWFHQIGGDGFHSAIDHTNSNIMYGTSQNGSIYRSMTGGTNGNSNFHRIADSSVNGVNQQGSWYSPFVLDHSNPAIMFAGFGDVWRSTNVNTANHNNINFINISQNQLSGEVIECIEQSPIDGDLIYIADLDGNKMYRCDNAYDANPQWIELSKPPGYNKGINHIEASAYNSDVVYIAISTRIYRSPDKGVTWDNETGNLPKVTMKCIEVLPGCNEGIYVGTPIGVYYKEESAYQWVRFKSDLPLTIVEDLVLHTGTTPYKLFAATYGRGVWETEIESEFKPNLHYTSAGATVDQTEVTINVEIENVEGMVSSDPCVLGYYISANNIITDDDYLIGSDNIPGLYPGVGSPANETIDVEYLDPPPPSGTYFIGAIIDKDFIIDELNEEDNYILIPGQVVLDQPSIPLNLQASQGLYGDKVVLTWEPPSGAAGTVHYRVFRNTYNNPNTAIELSSEAWSTVKMYWDENIEPGLNYYYWVKASYNYLGYRASNFSNYITGYRYLSPPVNVEATQGVWDDKIKITWENATNATHACVWRNTSTNVNTATPIISNWTSLNYIYDYDVEPGETYFYWLKSALSANGIKASPYYSSFVSGYVALTDAPVVSATDGDYTDRIEITWNAVQGASYYRLSSSYENDPENSNPMTAWTTATSLTDGSAWGGVFRYYWVQAATSIQGGNATGYSQVDSGWRKLDEVQNVQATVGTSTDYIEIDWDNNIWADYYKVYRHTNYFIEEAVPVSYWIEEEEFNDSTASPATDWIYWVLCAKDTVLTSDFQSMGNEGTGWRKFYEPEVYATDGVYNDKVVITWDPVFGEAGNYQVGKGPKFSNSPTEILEPWSGTLDYEITDYNVVEGEEYEYFVAAAFNNYGYHAGDYGQDRGVADECANITEDPDPSFRSVNITGNFLTVEHRIINNGPHPTGASFHVAYLLTTVPSGTSMGMIHEDVIPAIDDGTYYDNTTTINLQSCPGGPIPFGNYRLDIIYNSWNEVCETSLSDNDFHWEDGPFVQFTDAMYSEYTIGGISPDYVNFSEAVDDLIERGISGGVIFQVRPETYDEQISIPQITGSNEENYIRFRTESGHTDTAEISFSDAYENYVVQLNGANNLIFENLKISNPGFTNYQSTYARCIDIQDGTSNILFEKCRIIGSTELTYQNTDMALVYSGNNACNNITFDDNRIENGYAAFYIKGPVDGDDETFDIRVIENEIINFQAYGVYFEETKNLEISENLIRNSGSGINISVGVLLDNIEDGIWIQNNNIILTMDTDEYYIRGIDMRHCSGTDETKGIVANNMVATHSDAATNCSGLIFYQANNVGLYYNTISMSGATSDNNCPLFIEGESGGTYNGNQILNNVLINNKGGRAINFGHGAVISSYIDVMDYNDIYSTGDYLILYNQEEQLTNINEWYPLSGFGEHSVSCDPLFISNTDLHAQSAGINDIAFPLSEVDEDIDDDSRHPLFPDIGADEFMPPPLDYDIFVNDIIAPETAYDLSDHETVQLELYNVGANNVSNFPVSYRINGGTKITETVTETLEAGNVLWYTFATTANLADTGNYIFTAKTELPNDLNGANDTYIDTITNLLPYNCIPLYGMGCSGNSGIEDFHFSGLVHNGTGCSVDGYGDFTSYTTYAYQGESYQMEISLGYGEQFVSLWIDLDDDLIFEEEEKFVEDLYCANGNQTYSATVDIPNSALPGTHRMRVRCAWQQSPVHPCNYYQWGEAHDYNIDIYTGGMMWVFPTTFNTNCSGTPVEIFIDATGGAEPLSYLWSNGDTTASILVSPEVTTTYKVLVTDNDGYIGSDTAHVYVNPKPTLSVGGTTWLCEGENLQLNGSGTAYGEMPDYCSSNCDAPTGYCSSGATSSSNSIIEEVKIGNINNNTAGNCATYSDFTNLSATVVKNDAVDLEITIGTCGTENTKGAKIFVDWNRDGDFEDSWEDAAECWPEDTTTTHFTSLWVPEEAILGNTRMRIVAVETMDTWSITACGSYSYGETEDYTLNIAGTTTNQVISYEWIGPNGFTSSMQNPLINNVPAADSGYYHMSVTDGNSCTNTDSLFVYIQPTQFVIAGSDTMICELDVFKPLPEVDDFLSLKWTSDGTGYFDTLNIKSPTYHPSLDDIETESVVLTLTAYPMTQCADSLYSSLTLSIQKAPYANIPAGGEICSNNLYQISGVSVQNQNSYFWTTSGSGIFSDTTILNPVYFPSPTDVENGFVDLIINLEGSIPCIETTFTIPIFIQKEPMVYAGEDTIICSNGSLSLLSAYATDYDSLKWFTSGTGSFLDKYMENTEYFPSQTDITTGSVNLQLVTYPMMPCSDSIVSEITLTIIEETYADAGGPGIICANESFLLSEATATGFNSIQWVTDGTGYFDNPTTINPEYIPGMDETGTIILTLNAYGTSPCGIVSSPVYLDIMTAPVAVAGDNATIQSGESYLLFEATASDYTMIEWSTDGTGTFDDQYMLNPTYFTGTGETGDVELILTAYGNWPCDSVTSSMNLTILGGYDLDIKVLLEGPFNGTNMNTDLNAILPLIQPYGNLPWNYLGGETTALIPDPNIVDWVLVELRDAPDASLATPNTIIAQQAAFLRNNGQIVGVDGLSLLHFDASYTENLYVVIWHRNHLGIMSGNPILQSENVYQYDFTTSTNQTYGSNAINLTNGEFAMIGGDANADGNVNEQDGIQEWYPNAGKSGYFGGDANLDGQVNNPDKNDVWLHNFNKSVILPE